MSKRHWSVAKLEHLLLVACGSFWFHGCQDTSVSGPLYGTLNPGSSITGSSEASSSSVGGIQPVYGVIYSSQTLSSSSANSVSNPVSSSSMGLDSVIAFYGIIRPMSSLAAPSSSSEVAVSSSEQSSSASSSSATCVTGAASSSAQASSSSLNQPMPLYGVVYIPPTNCP